METLFTKNQLDEIIIKSQELESSDYSIKKVDIVKEQDCNGFLADYFSLVIFIEENINNNVKQRVCRYFVKSVPIQNIQKRDVVKGLGVFLKEFNMYSKVFCHFDGAKGPGKWRPECYLITSDLMVMEDLRFSFKHISNRELLDEHRVHLLLRAMAGMHAASINYDVNIGKQSIGDDFKEYLFETGFRKENTWFIAGLSSAKAVAKVYDKFHMIQDTLDMEYWDRVEPVFKLGNNTSREDYCHVLCHKDLWRSNLMFDNPPKRCILVDYQLCVYRPIAFDLLTGIFLNTRRSQRDQHLGTYLRGYYDYLKSSLDNHGICIEDVLTIDELIRSCDTFKLIPLCVNVVYYPLTFLPDGYLRNLDRSDPIKYDIVCNSNRNSFVLERMKEDPLYEEVVLEVVEELMEYIYQLN